MRRSTVVEYDEICDENQRDYGKANRTRENLWRATHVARQGRGSLTSPPDSANFSMLAGNGAYGMYVCRSRSPKIRTKFLVRKARATSVNWYRALRIGARRRVHTCAGMYIRFRKVSEYLAERSFLCERQAGRARSPLRSPGNSENRPAGARLFFSSPFLERHGSLAALVYYCVERSWGKNVRCFSVLSRSPKNQDGRNIECL